MTAVTVEPVATRRARADFVDLPYRLNRADPQWVAPLRMVERERLDPRKNPALAEKRYALFLARREGRVVGRIAAFTREPGSPAAERRSDEGGFGFFDAIDDPRVAAALVGEARAWLQAEGRHTMVGPMAFSTNEECGVLVEGFETPPTLLNVHNPPYYDRLLCEAGLQKAKDLLQFEKHDLTMPERYQHMARRRLERMGLTIRTATRATLEEDARTVGRIFNDAWSENWGFEALSEAEIVQRAKDLRLILRPDWVAVAEHEGRPVGVAVALPDLNVVLRKHPSGALLPNLVGMLWMKRRVRRIRVALLGVAREVRQKGLEAAMLSILWRNTTEQGVVWAEAGWVLEDNLPMRNVLERLGFVHYKTQRMYELPA